MNLDWARIIDLCIFGVMSIIIWEGMKYVMNGKKDDAKGGKDE